MKVIHHHCGPFANESERTAFEHLRSRIGSALGPDDDRWMLLTNLTWSVTHQLQAVEIDMVAIGPPGVRVIEVKHWTRRWVDQHPDLVEQAADQVAQKAAKIGSTARRSVANVGRVDGVILLTRESADVRALAGKVVRGVRLCTLKEWREAVDFGAAQVLHAPQVALLGRLLAPKSAVALDGKLRRFAGYANLERRSPPDDRFHRVYRGAHATRQDKVIVHLYDLSADGDAGAETRAMREFRTLHHLQLHTWAPRLLDSWQPAPGYAGEMHFFTVTDPLAPSVEARAKDGRWDTPARVAFAREALGALFELHAATVDGAHILHRNLTPETVLVRHDNTPIFTGFHLSKIPAERSVASVGPPSGEWPSSTAPEVRAQGLAAATAGSDRYALCASLRVLFDGRDDQESRQALDALASGMADEPAQRSEPSALYARLSALLGESPPTPPPPPARFWTEDQIVPFGGHNYRVVERLGAGGVGTAFKVVELDRTGKEELGTYVAKVCHDQEAGRRAVRAYRLARSHLQRHPAVSGILEVASEWRDDEFTALMTWVDGSPLREWVGVLPLLVDDLDETSADALALFWLRRMCEALHVLHRAGLVHGDVSPGNLIVSGRDLVLTDYDFVTRIGDPVASSGAPLYCAPPQPADRPAAPADDLYALAASFFHVLFDREPFHHDGALAKERGLNWEAVDADEREKYPSVEAFLDRATDPDPERRFPSVAEALKALTPAAAPAGPSTTTPAPSPVVSPTSDVTPTPAVSPTPDATSTPAVSPTPDEPAPAVSPPPASSAGGGAPPPVPSTAGSAPTIESPTGSVVGDSAAGASTAAAVAVASSGGSPPAAVPPTGGSAPPSAGVPPLGAATPPPASAPPAPERRREQVEWLRSLLQSYPGSVYGNSETRGLDSDFAAQTYVETPLETALLEDLRARRVRLVVLCGNAGDGKTALLQHLAASFGLERRASSDRMLEGSTDDGLRVRMNLDGSASWQGRSADDLLDEFLAPFRDGPPDEDVAHLLAINDGRLLEWIERAERRDGETGLTRALVDALNRAQPHRGTGGVTDGADQQSGADAHIRFIYLNQRSLVGGVTDDGTGIQTDFLERLLDHLYGGDGAAEIWAPCKTCSAQERCGVFQANRQFGPAGLPDAAPTQERSRARARLFEALQAVHLRGETHITVRELRAALVYILFGVHYCDDYHEGALPAGRRGVPEYWNPAFGPFPGSDPESEMGPENPLPYWDRAFDPQSPRRQGAVLADLARFDPALDAHPRVDRHLVRRRQTGAAQGPASHPALGLASARRRAYFEWSDRDIESLTGDANALDLARGRHLRRFRRLPIDAGERDAACRALCKGISRLATLPPQAYGRPDVVPLRITPRTPTETAFWIEKPADRFRLEPDLPPARAGLDRLHRRAILVYRYRDGREERLRLGAELFHLLLELSEGYQLGDASTDDTFAHLSIFVQRLEREDDRRLLAWSPMRDDAIHEVAAETSSEGELQRVIIRQLV